MYIPKTKEEQDFLAAYDASKYDKPSVTVDIVIFTLNEKSNLSVLLIKRKDFPYKDCWAIPGGFVDIYESIDDAAKRELFEETAISNVSISQFGTFGEVDRDPRTRVISIAYMAFVPQDALNIKAGDDASDAQLFEIRQGIDEISLIGDRNVTSDNLLAFDHGLILKTALKRLYNRIDYTDDAFAFLKDDQSFTIFELKKIYDSVLNKTLDLPNFRREFERKYVAKGLVVDTGKFEQRSANRPARLYKKLN